MFLFFLDIVFIFGTFLEQLLDHFETVLASFWDHSGTNLGSFWDRLGIILGQNWNHICVYIYICIHIILYMASVNTGGLEYIKYIT